MRKLILMALAGTAIALAVPQSASAMPLPAGNGLATAADAISTTQDVRWRRWHRWHRYRVYRVYRRHCWHRRYWSGRRCW